MAARLKCLMYLIGCGCFFAVSATGATCDSANPYTLQTCQQLDRSVQIYKESKEKAYHDSLEHYMERAQQRVDDEKNQKIEAAKNAKAQQKNASTPAWKRALEQKKQQTDAESDQETAPPDNTSTYPGILPLPAPGRMQLNNQDSINLKGVQIIPTKPKHTDSAKGITYY